MEYTSHLPNPGGLAHDWLMKPNDESTIRVTDEMGGRSLTARVHKAGDDVVVVVGGGDRPHVGCVVLSQPGRPRSSGAGFSVSSSVLTIVPHKEEPIARAVAERVCGDLGRVVVVTAGVHEDGIDRVGIQTYLRLGDELASEVVKRLARLS